MHPRSDNGSEFVAEATRARMASAGLETWHAQAEGTPDSQFYTLEDKFEDIEAQGDSRWLDERAEPLRTKTYCPQAACS